MRSNYWMKHLAIATLLGMAGVSQAQYIAVNDHASGPGTATNATRYHYLGQEDGFSGPLKDVNTGVTLPVTMTITRGGLVNSDLFGAAPAQGTPLFQAFDGLVDWANNANNNAGIGTGASVTNTFSGLDPTKTYILQGGAVRGNPTGTNWWSLFSLVGADGFTTAHTAGCLVSAEVPADIQAHQVAMNTGRNHLLLQGDMFEWRDIQPGADGIIRLVSTRYTGAVPGGTSGGFSPRGYAPTALKLIEAVEVAPVIVTQPQSVVGRIGEPASFTVGASGFPLNYQWYRNGSIIQGATGSRYSFVINQLSVGATFTVVVSNNLGSETSQAATVVVLVDPFQVVPYNRVWRYDRSGSNLGTSWRDNDFGDTGWPSGPGPLGFPANEGTPVPIATSFTTHNNITYYFRTTFVFDEEPTDFELVFTNFVDDGAVFYLNEQEVLRVEMPAAPAVIDFVTPSSVGDEFTLRGDAVGNRALVKGTNYLAVEVHQINTTSSDAIMGLNVWARPLPPGPLTITEHPQSQVVEELKQTVFTVGISGNGARFQWLKDGVEIEGATGQSLVIPETLTTDAGEYSVRVSNAFSDLESLVAILTVLADDTAPVLLEADGSLNTTNILVLFSEKVTESQATNPVHYRLTRSDFTGDLTISSLVYTNDGTAVWLTTQPRLANVNYLLIVNNITDVSPQANLIATNSTEPVIREIELVGWYGTWSVYDPFPPFDPLNPGAGWQNPGFNASSWANGTGPFVYNAPNNELPVAPAPIYFSLSQGSTTKFFRNTFNYTASLLGASFKMQHMVDDGIIAYLNGQEFHRFNLPEGAVSPTTAASTTVGAATIVDVPNIPAGGLLQGNNLLAVELHGTAASDLDWVFAMNFKVRIKSYATGPVLILEQPSNQTVMEGQSVTFSFDGVGPNNYAWRTNGVTVANSNTPRLTLQAVPLAWDGMVVSVVALNGTSSATSSNAVLTVIPDNLKPQLVAGYAETNRTSILLSFSEWIDPTSGGTAAHYFVTDALGANYNVTSAMVTNNTNVLLQTASYDPFNQIKVTVNNVRDIALMPNTIASNSAVIIGYETVLLPRTATWDFNDQGVDLFTAGQWTSLGYEAEGWSSGVATFVARNEAPEDEDLPAGWPFMTEMMYGASGTLDYVTNYYFRTVLNVPGELTGTVIASNLVDDGGVFYVNGTEVGRHRVTGLPTANTFAASRGEVTDGNIWDVFEFDAAQLVAGDNLVAVTVHQTGNTSSDAVFATEFFLRADPILFPGEQPPFGISYDIDTDEVVITWPSPDVLTHADDVLGTYTDVPGATSPYRIAPEDMKKFYRTRTP